MAVPKRSPAVDATVKWSGSSSGNNEGGALPGTSALPAEARIKTMIITPAETLAVDAGTAAFRFTWGMLATPSCRQGKTPGRLIGVLAGG